MWALDICMRVFDVPARFIQRRFGLRYIAWFFLLPNLVLFVLFALLPAILNIFYAMTGGEEIALGDRPYIGVVNFTELLSCTDYMDPNQCEDDLFWRAIFNTFKFVLLQVGFMIGFAMLTALILNKKIVARGFFRSVFFFPVLLSPVVVALIWKWILQRNGLLDAWWTGMLGQERVDWLFDSGWAFSWSVFLSVWAHMGFYTLIILAGLQAIPKDVYDAAKMDGASPFRTFSRITLPLLTPTMAVVVLLAMIKSVQTFDEVYALTGGGPGTATTLIIQYVYETGFAGAPRLLGLASAASLILATILVFFTVIQFRVNRGRANG
jgi:alpha-1,4-digalacturonate transport system permease protein